MKFKKKKSAAGAGEQRGAVAQFKERLTGDKVYMAFAGVFTFIGFLTVFALVLTANFLTEQLHIMTQPVSDVDSVLSAQTALNAQAAEEVGRALGIGDLDL